MGASEDRILENLVRGSEDLLRDIGIEGASPGEIPAEIASLESFVEPSADGQVSLDVSKDEMIVRATFIPPTGNGSPVMLEAVQAALGAKGVTEGVDWEALKGCILTCHEERVQVADMVIARGRRPVDEVPPALVIPESYLAREKAEVAGEARVDFRELSLFVLVKKDDVLATLTAKQEGALGRNVRGIAVPFRKVPVPSPKPGKNTQWKDGKMVATCDGRFQATTESFWVDEVLSIQGDVDLSVGNIDFPGDVVIQGELRDGFVVKAGKSVLCGGSINAARVECKGNLVTKAGIIGKDKAVLRVGGSAEAKFIEACTLDCDRTVRVRTSVLNSAIRTGDRLEMGDRGIIIGGFVKASNGVSAAQIGTERGPRTEIYCGLNYDVERKLIWIRDRNIALAFRLKEIEGRMKSKPAAHDVLAPLHAKVKAAIHQLNENARSLVSTLDRNEEATVSVREMVYPGTYIEICHVSYIVTKPRRGVTFRLDKTSGRIVDTHWGKVKDGLKLALSRLVSDRRGAEERRELSSRIDGYAAALDMFAKLEGTDTEEQIASGICAAFKGLFGARDVAYATVERGVPRMLVQAPGAEGEKALEEVLAYLDAPVDAVVPAREGGGFVMGLARDGELIGIVVTRAETGRGLAGRLELARALSGVCGMAVDGARANARIRAMDDERVKAVRLESLGLLAGGMAHDFNNLLTIILGNADLLARSPADAQEVEAAAKAILGSARRAAGIVERLLAAAAAQMLRREEADLNALVSRSFGAFQSVLGTKIEIHLDLCGAPIPVLIDVEQMRTVLVNLADNARDAMGDEGLFTVRTGVVGSRAVISLTDTGRGMDEGTREKIFEPYFTTREFGKSAGWGLAVCHGIVKQHSGEISVESAPGKGTIFTITLPLALS